MGFNSVGSGTTITHITQNNTPPSNTKLRKQWTHYTQYNANTITTKTNTITTTTTIQNGKMLDSQIR
jgi:hypothetical protein